MRTIAVIVMLVALGAAPAIAAMRPTVAQVTQGLTCQCGCGLTVDNCNMPQCSFSVPLRSEVQSMIDRGQSGAQIIAFYRARYGEKVLSAPTTEGFNILAWVMPFAALFLGTGLVGLAFSRWRRKASNPLAAQALAREEFSDDLRRRLDDALKERN
jgi:cytochrome c-type biogenesis protein CcmH